MNIQKETEVSLEEMLMARELRVNLQSTLIRDYRVSLICFTLNIPGPVKVFEGIPEAFESGCEQIEHVLERSSITFYRAECLRETTGYEAFYCVDCNPERLKGLMTPLEDGSAVGRLYDIDIIRIDGLKVSREDLGLPARSCLLCGEAAHACSRSRRHTVEQLVARIKELLMGKDAI